MLIVYFVRPRNKTLFSDDVVTLDAVSDVNVSNLLPVVESIASH
jgi:septin family protein